MNYQLSVTSEQAKILSRALDLFARIGVGQYEAITNLLRHTAGDLPPNIEQAERLLQEVKRVLNGHGPNASFGIYNPAVPEIYRQAFDLCQVIDQRLHQDNPGPFRGADRDVFPTSQGQPLATMEVTAK